MARPFRHLTFATDFYADPVWTVDGAMVMLEALPISTELRQDLRAWATEVGDSSMAEIDGRPLADDEQAAERARGVALCARLRLELGDAFEIVSSGYD